MTADIPKLTDLEYISYLSEQGTISPELGGKIGVYAIFDQNRILQYVGYSRNIALSLKQHLIRQPDQCYWLKVQTITRPSRTVLDNIRTAWIRENGEHPRGNREDEEKWTQPINIKPLMPEDERQAYQQSDELAKSKLLKKICRKIEAEILEKLKTRNFQEEIRFNPKLKEQGLLDLK
jgi:hypothetical protein